MVDDAGRIDESRMWQAVERLEAASQATREEQVGMNVRLDTMRDEQTATNTRIDGLEESIQVLREEQVSMNTRLNTISEGQHAMTLRIDALEARMTARIDRLFYAIIGGSIAVTVAVLAQGFIGE